MCLAAQAAFQAFIINNRERETLLGTGQGVAMTVPISASATCDQEIVLSAVTDGGGLSEDFIRVPPVETRRVESSLTLTRVMCRWQEFVLFNGHFVSVRPYQKSERVANLAYLSTQPVTVRESAWRWLLASIVIVAGALTTAFIQQWQESVLLSIAAIAALVGYVAGRRDRVFFRTRFGGIAVFDLSVGLFQRAQARLFIALIQERISGAASILPDGDQRYAAEIAEHRRMLSEGWLSQSRYDVAKGRLFARYSHSELL